MAGFTPGPWKVNATVHADRRNIFGLNPTAAFHIGTLVSGSKSKLDVLDANARLIAAAPELYEALEALTEASDACDPRYERYPGYLQELSNAARLLLAKARGEQVSA